MGEWETGRGSTPIVLSYPLNFMNEWIHAALLRPLNVPSTYIHYCYDLIKTGRPWSYLGRRPTRSQSITCLPIL